MVQMIFLVLGLGQVSHFWFVFENFPKKSQIFQFSPFGSKKLSSDEVKKYPCQRWVGLLFTESQKYARVWSGPISSEQGCARDSV